MGSLERRLGKLEARLIGKRNTQQLEESLRQAFGRLSNGDLDKIGAALERVPDDGSTRVPVELLTSEEAASLRRLCDLVTLRQQP